MERVATLLGSLLGLTLLLFLQLHGTQATGRGLSYPDPLPPCSQVHGGIPGWDCYDPPNHPLPPCDFHHQRIGFDCSGWPPVSHAGAASPTTFKSKTRPLLERHIAIDLPPCSQASDGSNSWKCYDAPKRHLPPCDIINRIVGYDCSGWPPAVGSDSGEASPATVKSETAQEKGGHVEAALPPCSEVPGGIPGWKCYDPQNHEVSPATVKSETTQEKGGHVKAELPPCSQVHGGIPGWDCYDPPSHPLPPCDFHHQRIGFDCSGWPPAVESDAGEVSPATVKSETMQEKGGHVEAELPPCSQVHGGIPGWDCYDPPSHPLPPCDFHHQRIGFDCSGWPPAAAP